MTRTIVSEIVSTLGVLMVLYCGELTDRESLYAEYASPSDRWTVVGCKVYVV